MKGIGSKNMHQMNPRRPTHMNECTLDSSCVHIYVSALHSFAWMAPASVTLLRSSFLVVPLVILGCVLVLGMNVTVGDRERCGWLH